MVSTAAGPVSAPARRGTFRSLRNRNYRLFAAGAALANVGSWMQRIAQDWLILEITGSGLAVGVVTALQFLPMLLIGPAAGVLADRHPKRRILVASGTVMGLAAALLGGLVLAGGVRAWHVYALALTLGIGAAVDGPTRQAYVRELVGPDDLANAVSLNAASFHTARIAGPALAGLLIAHWGTGPVFLLTGGLFLLVFLSLTPIDAGRTWAVPPVSRQRGQLREATRYLWARPELVVVIALAGVLCAFALNFQVTITMMAIQVYGMGAGEFGLLSSVMAIGSIAGALLSARRSRATAGLAAGSALLLGALYLVAGAMPTYLAFAALMIPIGFVSNTFMTSSNTTVQLAVGPELQGRVMAVYIAVSNAGTPLGAPFIGWVAEHFSARWSLWAAGATGLLGGLAALIVLGALRRAAPRKDLA